MDEIERFLPNLHHLKHLELQLEGYYDLADGHRWQRLSNSLVTFNFEFDIDTCLTKDILNSFRTPFWIEDKRWFVAYQSTCLFSIPRFAPVKTNTSHESYIYSTMPDDEVIYEHVTHLTVVSEQWLGYRFTNIKTLELRCSMSMESLLSIADLNQVEHLCILSLNDLLIFTPIVDRMPRLSKISVENSVTKDIVKLMENQQFDEIHDLHISIALRNYDYIFQELLRLFPCIQYFTYNSLIHSIAAIIDFIDGFKHLQNASFLLRCPSSDPEQSLYFNPDSIVLRTRRLTNGRSTCRVYKHSDDNSLLCIEWWIEV